jgi:general secretion pathway protein G
VIANRRESQAGSTLVELLVVMVILSILAVTAIPFAQTASQRRAEITLRETLRGTRQSIDAFHADWAAGRFSAPEPGVSDDGYPVTLEALVAGINVTNAEGGTSLRRYLRRFPENPFAERGAPYDQHWTLIGYGQQGVPMSWDRKDVYDLRAATDREALDGTKIAGW